MNQVVEDINKAVRKTDGWKTYLLCVAGIAVILVNHFVATVPGTSGDSAEWLNNIYQLLLVMTGRRALSEVGKPSATGT